VAIVSLSSAEESQLETLAELLPELSVREAVPLLVGLASNPAFLDAHVLPLLQEAREAEDWYVAHSCEGQNGSYSLQVFVWPPGTRTQIHDHTSWGVYCCAIGVVLEERYERLDDDSRPGYARLKKVWQLVWRREDGASTVLPYEEGIHRVGNPGAATAISVHLYGPQMGEVDGRDYDPSRNFVCDRVDAPVRYPQATP
jgi:predicted metal-dependent enzyme (double-stranded beta helix superfamily)